MKMVIIAEDEEKTMKLIDTHVHIFPDKIATNALNKISAPARKCPTTNGMLFGTLKKMEEWGVSEIWAQCIATNLHQVESVNDFAISIKSEKVLPFGSVFPHAVSDSLFELKRIKEKGIQCIKLHPEYQRFEVSDEKFFPIYEFIEKNGMLLLFHAGKDCAFLDTHYASPQSIRIVHDVFPKLKMICAHLGGWNDWDDVLRYTAGCDIYFDTATLAGYISPDELKAIFKAHPLERILFASDAPWSTPQKEIDTLKILGLSNDDMEKICYKNAENLKAEMGIC
ncbi:MAG TPA: amidohydrolase family protein [Clostridia bacterium]|nr:amidohydrolase family protein [Clostridia bacterium]